MQEWGYKCQKDTVENHLKIQVLWKKQNYPLKKKERKRKKWRREMLNKTLENNISSLFSEKK